MPRGLTGTIKAELNATTLGLPIYCVRVTRAIVSGGSVVALGIYRWAEQAVQFDDGSGLQSYEARLRELPPLDFSPDEAGSIAIVLANVDDFFSVLDRTDSFQGAKVELIAFLPNINEYYIVWSGWSDELTEISAEQATLRAYPTVGTPNLQIPSRLIGLPCTNVFANTANWTSVIDYEGSECPYGRTSTIGFQPSLNASITATATSADILFGTTAVAAGAAIMPGDLLQIESELVRVTGTSGPPNSGTGIQTISIQRGANRTTPVAHTAPTAAVFSNCFFSVSDCSRRGMYGNNPADTYGPNKRNYFAGFPFLTGYQYGTYRSKAGERTQPLRLVFSGNDSAYSRTLPIVYGRARVADPILIIAKPEGDFLTTLWLVAEGVLATNAVDDTQTDPTNAYSKSIGGDGFAVENIFVNGRSRHDRRPGFGIEISNGDQDRPQPSSAFFPSDPSDFLQNNFGFWGTARVTMRINQKDNPSVDITGQSVSGTFEVQYGRIHRIYTSTSTYVRRATADGNGAGANPSWVMLDLFASKRAGAGLDYSRFNIQSFIDLATYCSATVSNVFDGTSVKRWTFNGVIDQRKALQEWAHLISQGMYSLPPFQDKDGKLKVRALKAETLTGVPLFSSKVASTTGRSIIWDDTHSSLVKRRKSINDVPNEVRINYIDKSYDPGFAAQLRTSINSSSDPVTFTIRWSASAIAAGVRFIQDDKIMIGSEKMWITTQPAPPDVNRDQSIHCQRAYGATAKAAHAVNDVVQFTGNAYARISMVVSDRDAARAFGAVIGDQTRRVLTKTYDLPGTTTLDEAARIGTLILRAGEFGQGGLANNLQITFRTFYRLAEDLEIGDIIQVEDDLLDPALNEIYFRVTKMSAQPQQLDDGGIVFTREIEAVLHDNAIYDDTAFTVSDYTRVDAGGPTDGQPPPVTDFFVVESGIFDQNGVQTTNLFIEFTPPSPLENFRSVIIYRSSDDGSGNPVGDWRFVGEVTESGTELQDEVTGNWEFYCAVSRSLSGHHGDIDAVGEDGNYIYPRVRILVDGVAELSLAAPTGLQAFGRLNSIYLRWNAYTGQSAQLMKRFNVYRNTVNNNATATQIAQSDTNWFKDDTDTVAGAPTTVFYYWVRGVSKLENVTIDGVLLDGLSPFSASASDNPGTDTGLPDAPVINVLQDVLHGDGTYTFLFGVDSPGSPANWDTVEDTEFQISKVSDFSTTVYDRVYALTRPPFTDQFTVKSGDAGVYYFRARVKNIFGYSAWSATFTRSTDPTNAVEDTDIIPVPTNVTITIAASGNDLEGNEILVEFDPPTTQMQTEFGFEIHIHDSATMPLPDVDGPNSSYAVGGMVGNGQTVVGSNILTDPAKSFPTTGGGLIDRRVVIFSPKRPTSGASWPMEGAVTISKVQGNTATTLTLDTPNRFTGNAVQYMVLTAGGQTSWDKFKQGKFFTDYAPVPTKASRFARRSARMTTGLTSLQITINMHNIFGAGKIYGPIATTITGITADPGPIDVDDVHGDGSAPGAPTALTADAAFRMILLNWTPASNTDLKGTEVWRATVNNRASAALIATIGMPLHMWADERLTSGTTYYYWVRHTDWDGLTSAYFPSGATSGVSAIATDSGTQRIVAPEIFVANLAAINADLGNITAGTITMIGSGSFIKTASTGARIEIDNVNGLRSFDAGGTLRAQIPVSGGVAGYTTVSDLKGISQAMAIANSDSSREIVFSTITGIMMRIGGSDAFQIGTSNARIWASYNLVFTTNFGIANAANNGSVALPSPGVELYSGTNVNLKVDGGDSSTQTAMLVRSNGSLLRVKVDTSDLGSGTKSYLYV